MLAPGISPPSDAIDKRPIVYIVDDDLLIRDGLRCLLEAEGLAVEDYDNSEAFLMTYQPGEGGCLLLDARLPGMSGIELLRWLRKNGSRIPILMMTGHSDVAMAVEAMKAGASDFLEKPVTRRRLVDSVKVAVTASRQINERDDEQRSAAEHIAKLTPRQKEILMLVVGGRPSKNIAADIGISQRTVESHRASIMRKLGAKSLPELGRIVMRPDAEKEA
ncbi:response regulator transcription factor [Asticcacaulis sp. 201]|uniref:response regulator transcription factor n=1 Tax=Asticcacaulis sp. 201 TaxID=3028787 RepID=UPI00291688AC|nr:response regulator [Asticcacaulis sp. 201]MDV6330973.1 response regulator [Asticcacaulis sp. 201]